jgi:hypothetical protein
MSKTKKEYREWIRNRHGSIHKTELSSTVKGKRWRINQNHIRETIIDQYKDSGYTPAYMITRNYYYDQQDRDKVVQHNDRMNNVIDDIINPRYTDRYMVTHDHFIERHKDKLVRKNPQKVLNVFTQEYEMDWAMEVKKGGFHVHTLVSYIHDDVILSPNSKIRKSIEKIYGMDQYPISLLQDEWGLNRIKTDLLDYAIRDRCDFIGNSDMSMEITSESEYEGFDGYNGWKGMVAYVCKTMYNVDKMVEVYDHKNNTILCV